MAQSFHEVDKHHPVCGVDKQEKLNWTHLGSLPKDKEETQLLKVNWNSAARRLQALLNYTT